MTAVALRAMLAAGPVLHAPGVYDPASAALAVRAGHRAVHLSETAIAATMLGHEAPTTQIADRAALLAPVLDGVPLLADADLGADSADHAVWTALAYQRAGISGLVLDDAEDAVLTIARITALVEQAPEVALIVRARGGGPAWTIDRCRAYAAAGAEVVLPVDLEDLDKVRAVLPGVPLAVDGDGPAGPGVVLALHPLGPVLAALRAASLTYRAILEEPAAEPAAKPATPPVDRLPLAVLHDLIGPPPVTTAAAPAATTVPTRTADATARQIDKIDT